MTTNNTTAILANLKGRPDEWHNLFGILFACHAVSDAGNSLPIDTMRIAERLDELKKEMIRAYEPSPVLLSRAVRDAEIWIRGAAARREARLQPDIVRPRYEHTTLEV